MTNGEIHAIVEAESEDLKIISINELHSHIEIHVKYKPTGVSDKIHVSYYVESPELLAKKIGLFIEACKANIHEYKENIIKARNDLAQIEKLYDIVQKIEVSSMCGWDDIKEPISEEIRKVRSSLYSRFGQLTWENGKVK